MSKKYGAVYYNPAGRFYNAIIFLTSVTVTIRYTDEINESKDVYWLAENIVSLEQQALTWVLEYKNTDGSMERLVIRDIELVEALKKELKHHRFAGGWRQQILGSTRNKLVLLIAIVGSVILLAYFLFIPWLGERIARNISQEWEINLGDNMHRSMMAQYRIDSVKTELVNRFYQELNYKVSYPINVTVVEASEVNAFAIPGGHIVVYTSILDRMKRHEELAALLAHEASHIQLRHSLRNIFRSMARKMFLMLISEMNQDLQVFWLTMLII